MKRKTISVLVSTWNEEKNLSRCLDSVTWADEIVVVDMRSSDRTVAVARRYTRKVYSVPWAGYAEPGRAFAQSRATGDWILIVDADETVTPGLRDRLRAIADSDRHDIAVVPFRTYFFGREMKGGGWGPGQERHPRFFRRSLKILTDRVHDMFEIPKNARVTGIKSPDECLVHFPYRDWGHFLDKWNRYSTLEARNAYEGKKNIESRAIVTFLKMKKQFLTRYLLRGGFRDGLAGLALALMMALYKLIVFLKLRDMKKFRSADAGDRVRGVYGRIASRVMARGPSAHRKK